MEGRERIERIVDEWNETFCRLHTEKEDLFWQVHMGSADDEAEARRRLAEAEGAVKRFLGDPERLETAERLLAEIEAAGVPQDDDLRLALVGWRATFEANVVRDPQARRLEEELAHDEQRLLEARSRLEHVYVDPTGARRPMTSVEIAVRLGTDPDERVRRFAFSELRRIERHVLERGFLDLVKKRNRFGRLLGGEDFYDAMVRRTERMTKAQIFAWLDELEERTRPALGRALERLRREKGESALEPHNVRWYTSGSMTRERDPYFPFGASLARWAASFAALGIAYRGATVVVDLVDRPGKYPNGFMHGPVPAWRRRGRFQPARIQFSANAVPGVVGSGERATETLFHEGGHAAHFANVDMPAPCFAQEFAPSSVALAETQSMFLDSLLGDPGWLARYARDREGRPMPLDLIEREICERHDYGVLAVRGMLAVCYAERAIYELPDEELCPERVLEVVRHWERRLLGLEQGSPRPVLSVPHLLSNDSSAYYHGYVLAEMAVWQTRRFFEERDGHVADNPRVGPHLRERYWREGNLRTFPEFVERATGAPLAADALVRRICRDTEEAVAEAREAAARAGRRPPPELDGLPDLDLRLVVAHGRERIAEGEDFSAVSRKFAAWIDSLERSRAEEARS